MKTKPGLEGLAANTDTVDDGSFVVNLAVKSCVLSNEAVLTVKFDTINDYLVSGFVAMLVEANDTTMLGRIDCLYRVNENQEMNLCWKSW